MPHYDADGAMTPATNAREPTVSNGADAAATQDPVGEDVPMAETAASGAEPESQTGLSMTSTSAQQDSEHAAPKAAVVEETFADEPMVMTSEVTTGTASGAEPRIHLEVMGQKRGGADTLSKVGESGGIIAANDKDDAEHDAKHLDEQIEAMLEPASQDSAEEFWKSLGSAADEHLRDAAAKLKGSANEAPDKVEEDLQKPDAAMEKGSGTASGSDKKTMHIDGAEPKVRKSKASTSGGGKKEADPEHGAKRRKTQNGNSDGGWTVEEWASLGLPPLTVPTITSETTKKKLRPMQFYLNFVTERSTAKQRREDFLKLPEDARVHIRELTRIFNQQVRDFSKH
jgi:hypothetical protein